MQDKQFEIELLDIHWLEETPEEIDLCAHGQVRVLQTINPTLKKCQLKVVNDLKTIKIGVISIPKLRDKQEKFI
jgi:hypothetical protein